MQIYIGITVELCIKNYWKNLNIYSTKYIVKKYIRVVQFQQLAYYFWALPLWLKLDKLPKSIFNRVYKVTKYI